MRGGAARVAPPPPIKMQVDPMPEASEDHDVIKTILQNCITNMRQLQRFAAVALKPLNLS